MRWPEWSTRSASASRALRRASGVLAMTHFGGHADLVCVPAEQVLPIPDAMSFEEAAALPVNYLTAYHMLFRVAAVRPGERVLVHMAAGGLGTAALQLCRTVDGVQTFGRSSAAKHEAIREEGCTHPIDYHATDYVKEVGRLTDGEGVDVVLDPLGGADSRKGLKLLRPGGRLVVYGFANMTSGERRSRARMVRPGGVDAAVYAAAADERQQGRGGVHIGRLSRGSTCSPRTHRGPRALGAGSITRASTRTTRSTGQRSPPADLATPLHRRDRPRNPSELPAQHASI